MEQEKYTYVVCTSEGSKALQRLLERKKIQRGKVRNNHGRLSVRTFIWAVEIIRDSGENGVTEDDLRAKLLKKVEEKGYDLPTQDVASVMRVIRREIKPIVEAHRCSDETPKAS